MSFANASLNSFQNVPPTTRTARPFLKWVGGKGQLIPQISERLPSSFGTYFEPFVGGGAVFFALQPQSAVLSDVNSELINVYTAIRDNLDELIAELSSHHYEKDYFYEIRNADRLPSFNSWRPARRAARLIYLNKSCFNGLYRVSSKGHFNVPFGRYTNPTILDRENLSACHSALAGKHILEKSFLNVEEMAQANDFVYFDPPYAPVSATANFTSYSKDGFGVEQQTALRDLCLRLDSLGVQFLLSNSDTPLIQELYSSSKFNCATVHASRAVNSKASARGKITELLISNY